MSYVRNRVDSHILLNVERIDLNERLQHGELESSVFKKKLHGIIAEGFEHIKSLNHVNVCNYSNMLRIDGNAYLFISEGYSLTLNKVFKSTNKKILNFNPTSVINQMICGLQYLHTSGLAHGRLTLDAISVSDEGLVKIGGYAQNYINSLLNYMCNKTANPNDSDSDNKDDNENNEENKLRKNYIMNPFGFDDKNEFIKVIKNSSYLCNLMLYMPPEVIFYNEKLASRSLFWYNVDIWSLGICILLIMSYTISANKVILRPEKNHYGGDTVSLESDNECYERNLGFERLKKLYNIKCISKTSVVETFLFVLYLLVLINKLERQNGISTIGLDIYKIVKEQFKFLLDENESNDLKLISKIFESINENLLNNKDEIDNIENNNNNNNNNNKSNISVNNSRNDKQALGDRQFDGENEISCDEAISTSIGLLTGRDVVINLIRLNRELEESSGEYKSYVLELNYLLSIVNDCLIIDNLKRCSVVDLCTRYNILKLGQKGFKEEEEIGYSWFTYKEKMDCINELDSYTQEYSVETLKESQTNLSESKFFLNYVGMENVLYYWTLLGNEISNIIPFQFTKRVNSNVEEGGKRNESSTVAEYFKRYKVGQIVLGELITHVKLANLFPMIIEHQLRPSCVYARQQCFIYQLLRIRRFKRLLSNAGDNRRQIFVEAMIDIPPLLRNQIWCNLLEVVYRPAAKECPISTEYKFDPIPPELEQKLGFYNNDLLYSTTNVKRLLYTVESLKRKIIHQQLPSSIYSFSIPLMLLYHNSSVYNAVVDKIFCKYLKDFYAPTGSFVNNYLSEFSTILNFFDPEISHHLRSIGAYADSYALPWFMSLFAENTPVNQLYLIWDSILVQPKQYIKFLAVMIIHNVRERLLSINDARIAISFISCVIDSLNVPMLMYLTTHMYTTWSEVLNPKASANKLSPLSEWLEKDGTTGIGNEVKGHNDAFNLDRNTFVFISDEYPLERCFKLSMETFSNVFKDCIIIDLRSLEAYNLGHIPNSIHINKLLSTLSEKDKKTNQLSIPIFNEKTTFNANMDFKADAVYTQSFTILNALRSNSKGAWLHQNSMESSKIVLAAGDGYDEENEMDCVRRLVFDYKLQHVCYYKINSEEWPKVLTLSKI